MTELIAHIGNLTYAIWALIAIQATRMGLMYLGRGKTEKMIDKLLKTGISAIVGGDQPLSGGPKVKFGPKIDLPQELMDELDKAFQGRPFDPDKEFEMMLFFFAEKMSANEFMEFQGRTLTKFHKIKQGEIKPPWTEQETTGDNQEQKETDSPS